MLEYDGLNFEWTGHDGFRIAGDKVIYIDPFQLGPKQKKRNDADVVFISHNHFDHLSIEDLQQVVSKKTEIIAAMECVDKLTGITSSQVKGVAPGDKLEVQGMQVEVVPAYNTNKTFHPKRDAKVGFVITTNGGRRIYHTGDTDEIPEMSGLAPDIALVPVSGTYVMTAEEAAHAVNEKIKPKKLAIPMHYGAIVGSEKDAARFRDLVKVCPVQILDRD
jgi:L-ascorbate metabolism protein UlaG (beta-lactamase superfamily)